MRKFVKMILMCVMVLAPSAGAFAADIDAHDRVSVLMPKSKVVSILGTADKTTDMGGLKVDLYTLGGATPLVGAGYLYESESVLAGHAFIFKGNVGRQAADRLQAIGFTLLEGSGPSFRLAGKDDDTGQPVVITIGENNDLTTVMTFEKGFYDRRVNK
ncbi:MAG: hypothetical protein ACYC5X_10415 [Syntrophales bacterium]